MTTADRATLDLACQEGYEDGAEAARESGSAEAPSGGWDGWLLNAVGLRGAARAFGLAEDTPQDDPTFAAALEAYARGCQVGADAEVAGAD